jgi:hypothetical protein
VPFLRLTRDRRGFENTFLLHAEHPGAKPRLLYWYRTAPGIVLGRPALDEDAIRTIEDSHPEIDFDWPAILALSEAMIHEDEAPAPRPQRREKKRGRDRSASAPPSEAQRRDAEAGADEPVEPDEPIEPVEPDELVEPVEPVEPAHHVSGLLEELVGREIATRLRARHAEILARIHAQDADGAARAAWLQQAEALDPDLWLTPEAVLEGVRHADAGFERLRAAVLASPGHSSRE